MKVIEWQKCLCHGVVAEYPPQNGKMLTPDSEVRSGMKVSAKYNDLTIMLEISEEIENQIFSAIIIGFEPTSVEKPSDLDEGDKVKIQRQHICCLFA